MEFNIRDLSFRGKIILWAVVGVLIIILLVWGLRALLVKKQPPGGQPKAGQAVTSGGPTVAPVPSLEEVKKKVKPLSLKEAKLQTSVAVTVRQFVERFGSFSIDSKLVNFDEVQSLATARFILWMNGYRHTVLNQLPSDVKGITTRFISMKNTGSDATHQSFEVATQRKEDTGALPRVYYQRIVLKLVLENNEWKIDSAFWQPKE